MRGSEAEPRCRVRPAKVNDCSRSTGEYDDAAGGARKRSAAAGDRGNAGAIAGGGGFKAQRSPHALEVAFAESDLVVDFADIRA